MPEIPPRKEGLHHAVRGYSLDDTIAAISTPLGEGGIGIVRMSGERSAGILERIFKPASARGRDSLAPRRLTLGNIIDPNSSEIVEEALVSYMPAPHTYTRQDIVEINCHGGILPTRRILELCLHQGARLADPGEFTLRAFLNGRIDLAQAEAVLDIIRARTDAGLQLAVGQLSGALSQRVKDLRQTLLEAQAHLVASIDFPEDEIPPFDLPPALQRSRQTLADLLEDADRGIIHRQGIRTAIIGRPNVGKSSLLNALLRTNRAIVTPIPGTTRDTVEETLNLHGIPVVLIDTAGLDASPKDYVEQLGIERSHDAIRQADLILAVVDISQPLQPEEQDALKQLEGRSALLVLNKADLSHAFQPTDVPPASMPKVIISALTGEGLSDLENAMLDMVLGGTVRASDQLLVSNPRHKQLLQASLHSIGSALKAYEADLPADFISIDLAEAIDSLGLITGETADEDLLDRIFAEFCIGK